MLDVARASRGLSVRLEISDSCLQSEKRCEKVHRLIDTSNLAGCEACKSRESAADLRTLGVCEC